MFLIPGNITVTCTIIDADGDSATVQTTIKVISHDTSPGTPWNGKSTIPIAIGCGLAVVATGFTIKNAKVKKRARSLDLN